MEFLTGQSRLKSRGLRLSTKIPRLRACRSEEYRAAWFAETKEANGGGQKQAFCGMLGRRYGRVKLSGALHPSCRAMREKQNRTCGLRISPHVRLECSWVLVSATVYIPVPT